MKRYENIETMTMTETREALAELEQMDVYELAGDDFADRMIAILELTAHENELTK